MLQQIQNSYGKVISYYKHLKITPTQRRCLYVCLGTIVVIWLVYISNSSPSSGANQSTLTEGFVSGRPQTVIRSGPEQIYDKFYSEVYDQLFRSDMKNEYEIMLLHKHFLGKWKETPKTKILDVGCGTGHHVRILHRYKHDADGLDQSYHFIKRARKEVPSATFHHGNLIQPKLFEPRKYTHITCLFYTIYYQNNLSLVFRNFNKWLVPKGMVFIHVVRRSKFDPVLERASSLIPLFDPQRYSKERRTQTKLHFHEFSYESDWNLKTTNVQFKEIFRFKNDPYTRIHFHRLMMPSIRSIIKTANSNGFELVKTLDLFIVGHGNNYILCFQKKYGE